MSKYIQRVSYYDREYLRAFDFKAEQNYHMEMRRRLNMALHLWGIVDGLEVLKGVLSPGLPEQFYISPGMAIDAYGREIVLFAPYALSDDDLVVNRVRGSGNYSIWIVYYRAPSTPPAPGYRVCDIKDQCTRWSESYRIFIPNDPTYMGSDPNAIPEPAAYLFDDPIKAPWPVRLGTVTVTNVGGKLTVTSAWSEERIYVGLRAQRIIVPHAAPRTPPVDPILSKNNPLDAPLSLGVQANVFAEKNLIVGDNFEIDKTKIKLPPAPATFPSPSGNLKVSSDLFLQGQFYANVAGDWFGLKEYVKSFVPDIQVDSKEIDVAVTASDPSNDTITFALTSTLPNVTRATIMVALSGIEWKSKNDLNTWWSTVAGSDSPMLQVSAKTPTQQVNSKNTFDFGISWSVGPKDKPAVGSAILHIKKLIVSYIAVFYP